MTHDALQTQARSHCICAAMCGVLQIQGSTEARCCGTCADSLLLDNASSGMSVSEADTSLAWGMPASRLACRCGIYLWYMARQMGPTIWAMPIEDPKQGFIPAPVLPKRQRAILIFFAHTQILPSSRQQC